MWFFEREDQGSRLCKAQDQYKEAFDRQKEVKRGNRTVGGFNTQDLTKMRICMAGIASILKYRDLWASIYNIWYRAVCKAV